MEYLGWKESRGVYGREFTEPIVRELINRRRGQNDLPKLTLQVSKKEVKITQEVDKKKGRIEKVKYPPIPAQDVTYAVQALSPDKDVVACVYLGYNPYTKCAVHVHIYRLDSEQTAEMFVQHLTQLTALPEHQNRLRKIEKDLAAKGQINSRYVNDGETSNHSGSGSSRSPPGSGGGAVEKQVKNDIANDITPYDSLAAELHHKLHSQDEAPLLLPPKDYDTICRKHGNLINVQNRRSKQDNIVGSQSKENHGDIDSGLGSGVLGSPTSDSPTDPAGLDSSYDEDGLRVVTPPWKHLDGAPQSIQRVFDGGPPPGTRSSDHFSDGPINPGHDYMRGTHLSNSSQRSSNSGSDPDRNVSYQVGGFNERRSLSRQHSRNSMPGSGHSSGPRDNRGPSPVPTDYTEVPFGPPQHSRERSDEGYNSVPDGSGYQYGDYPPYQSRDYYPGEPLRPRTAEHPRSNYYSGPPNDPLARTMPDPRMFQHMRGGGYAPPPPPNVPYLPGDRERPHRRTVTADEPIGRRQHYYQ